jgi:guanylate kinase
LRSRASRYRTSSKVSDTENVAGKLFILSAPSGSGKSTLVTQLRSLVGNLDFSVSYTTRPVRGSEQDGREYHFISRQHFERMIAEDEFLEYAVVFGNYYGTARGSVEHARQAGCDLILDIDIQGAAQVMQRFAQAVSIFILPPGPGALGQRLRNRSAAEHVTSKEVIETRLNAATSEVGRWCDYRYALVNDVLEDAVEQLKAIVEFERGEASAQIREMALSCLSQAPSTRLQSALREFGLGLPNSL